MEQINVDVVIPILENDQKVFSLLEDLKKQENIVIGNVVLPVTIKEQAINSSYVDKLVSDVFKIATFEVNVKDYSHSLTRERAIKEFCSNNVVVLLSHDVKFVNSQSIYNLVKSIKSKECAYAFGKQIVPKNCIEKYIREKNYPADSYLVTKNDIEQMQIMAFFASDAFSALDRNIFLKIGGYQGLDLITNEDMFYSYHVLNNGYSKKYCSDAVVEHYHKRSLKQLYRWYYSVGQFYKQVHLFDNYQNNSTGLSLAMKVLGKAFKHFDIISIICWLPNMAARYIGFKRGKKSK